MTFSEFKYSFLKEEIPEYANNTHKYDPVVSICIQTYNHENYIGQCLDSILVQKTNFQYEILIGEDDSTDNTRNICLDYAKKHPEKIRLFLHKRSNNIKVKNVATGLFPSLYNLYNSRGTFLAYCDGDDYWDDPEKLQKQVCFLQENPKYSMCFHKFNILRSNQSSTLRPKQVINDLTREELKKVASHPLIITFCFRNNIDIPFEITKVVNADNFLISILGHKGKGKFLDNIKPAVYRMHQTGVYSAKSNEERFLLEINTYRVLADYYIKDQVLNQHFMKRVFDFKKMLITLYIKTFKFKKLIQIAIK